MGIPWRGLGALEGLRESLEYIWGTLEGFAGQGAQRDAQAGLGGHWGCFEGPREVVGDPQERVWGGWRLVWFWVS